MSSGLAKSTCVIHPDRTAVARCPSCQRFFCGECVTEHDGRLVCAACLAESGRSQPGARSLLARIHPAPLLQFVFALLVVWLSLYFVARFLGGLPDTFHDGTIWE